MTRGRRVGGSGWAGVHGSYIGLGGKRAWPKAKNRKPTKPKRRQPEFRGYTTLREARAAGMNLKQWQKDCAEKIEAIEAEYSAAKKLVAKLKNELVIAEKARRTASQLEQQNTQNLCGDIGKN